MDPNLTPDTGINPRCTKNKNVKSQIIQNLEYNI